ncbi:MAG: Crp/Fnr family transcriptional regulator [Zavarzinia sp.]|nr:Crp/Fnr family transcriptional regulator [Zavarzinia sp.]
MDWIAHFPELAALEPEAMAILSERARFVQYPAGTTIIGAGRAPENMLLLIEGSIRVQQLSEQGREIVLYRARGGESCVLTTACVLAYQDYGAEAVTETEVRAVALPRTAFEEMIAVSPTFRRFVFTAYSRRIAELFFIIDEIAFKRVDGRLARKLLDLPADEGKVAITHQELAMELRTAREVVSRQLQAFQQKGWVALTRGAVELRDRAALADIAASVT